ncbi:hypothetical protein AVEN_118002-1 [Araneus ventricosus]|uniref:Uncharacterized protein n=1 Tax=Araneus ventricosus TaxID=182803 RepID=A0A4Y2C873_ARAVE|nr:hypothetical protein AVEN_118002-1 [Araneus ventricosus]
MTSRLQKKLDSIQRLFLLYITCECRTTPTSALQVVTGLQPLHLQIQQESNLCPSCSSNIFINFFTAIFSPTDYESKSSGIHIHLHNFLPHNQISFAENHRDSGTKAIYADGSKTDEGTSSAYSILENYEIIASWQGKLDHSTSVIQAERNLMKAAPSAQMQSTPLPKVLKCACRSEFRPPLYSPLIGKSSIPLTILQQPHKQYTCYNRYEFRISCFESYYKKVDKYTLTNVLD